ncbi:hypothetical protein ENUP19_0344G0002 [Entamoeba nuttalli]
MIFIIFSFFWIRGIVNANEILCQSISNHCNEKLNRENCQVLEINKDFYITKECDKLMKDINQINISKNCTITIDEDSNIQQKILVERGVHVILMRNSIIRNEMIIERDSIVEIPQIEIKQSKVIVKGTLEVQGNVIIEENSTLEINNNGYFNVKQGRVMLKSNGLFINGNESEVLIFDSLIGYENSSILFKEGSHLVVNNQIELYDNTILTIEKECIIQINGYFVNVFNNGQIHIGSLSLFECQNLYVYGTSIISIEDNVKLITNNIYVFQTPHLDIKNNVYINVKKYISSYSKAVIEIGNNSIVNASSIFLLYNTTLNTGESTILSSNSFELSGDSLLNIGKNTTITVSGKKLSKECLNTNSHDFCYSLSIKGKSTIIVDNNYQFNPIFNIQFGRVNQWNTTNIILMNSIERCVDLYSFKESYNFINEVEKEEYHLMCNKKLGRYCIGLIDNHIECNQNKYHCPCDETIKEEL